MFRRQRGHKELGDLMDAVTDYGTRTADQVESETGVDMQEKKKSLNLSAGLATIVSVVALVFSGFSFYETVLKQASLTTYAPPVIHMYREGFRDVFAIPVTLSNDGAQRGTVLSIDLSVKDLRTNKVKTFQSLYFGNSPKDGKRLFNPITVPGRSSVSTVVLFYAHELGSFVETTGGVKLPLQLMLKLNPDHSGGLFGASVPDPLTFDMTASFIASLRDMEAGRPTSLFDERWQSSKVKSAN